MLNDRTSYGFRSDKFPIKIEFLHPATREVVDSLTLEAPPDGQLASVYIPPVAKMVGHAVAVRMTFGDGEVVERDA